MRKSCTRTSSGAPFGRHARPAFLKSPTSSFFFVSTEITGCLAANASVTANFARRNDMKKRLLRDIAVSAVGVGCMGFSHGYGAGPDRVRRVITRFDNRNIEANQPLLDLLY